MNEPHVSSFGQKILYPWSHTNSKVADWEELHHMANTLAEVIRITQLSSYAFCRQYSVTRVAETTTR